MINFNHTELETLCRIRDIKREIMPISKVTLISIGGRDGAYFFRKRKEAKVIEVEIQVIGATKEIIRDKAKKLAGFLDTEKPERLTFFDEPGIYYTAIVTGGSELTETTFEGKATLTFVCPDPHGYSNNEVTNAFPSAGLTVSNTANAETFPKYRVEFSGDATFFSLVHPDGVTLIGNPAEVEKPSIPEKEVVFFDDANDLTQWVVNTNVPVENGVATGAVHSIESRIQPTDYGTSATEWHGPAIMADIPTALQDFRIDLQMSISSSNGNELGQLELLMLDPNKTTIGAMRTRDTSFAYDHPRLQWRAGDLTTNHSLSDLHGPEIGYYADSSLLLRVERKNTRWTIYCHKWENGKVTRPFARTFVFEDGAYNAKQLGSIAIFFAAYKTEPQLFSLNLERVTVWKVNDVTEQQTPAIFKAGDVLEIDTYNASALLNGESVRYLDPASKFPPIKPGDTEIKWFTDNPANVVVTESHAERWK